MAMIHVGNLGKGLFAQASESQNCDLLSLLFLLVYHFQMSSSILNLSIYILLFFIRKLSGLGLSGSMGYQLSSLTALTNL